MAIIQYLCYSKIIMNNQNQIRDLIKKTAEKFLPGSEVVLFGSRARNDASPESDYDTLIIINDVLSPKDKLPLRTKIRKALLAEGIRSDILIQSKEEVDKKRILPGHIIRSILKDAIYL